MMATGITGLSMDKEHYSWLKGTLTSVSSKEGRFLVEASFQKMDFLFMEYLILMEKYKGKLLAFGLMETLIKVTGC